MKRSLHRLLMVLILLFSMPAVAVQPDEVLRDPVLERRAREIGKDLRCLVCQNQSIDDSDADLARDLRIIVRERLQAGDSDEEVMAFMEARYGEFVLLKPPVRPATYLLWFGPILIAITALAGVIVFFRRRRDLAEEMPLTASEREQVANLLGDAPTDRKA